MKAQKNTPKKITLRDLEKYTPEFLSRLYSESYAKASDQKAFDVVPTDRMHLKPSDCVSKHHRQNGCSL